MVKATIDHTHCAVMDGRNLVPITDLVANFVTLTGIGLHTHSVTRKPRLVPFLRQTGFVIGLRSHVARKSCAVGISSESGGIDGSHCANSPVEKTLGVKRVVL
jgi:hypothetical protein